MLMRRDVWRQRIAFFIERRNTVFCMPLSKVVLVFNICM
jgi:hypothetical protein